MGEPIQSFTELRVYQMACELDYEIFVETRNWPLEEKYSLVAESGVLRLIASVIHAPASALGLPVCVL